ncbi:MAG: tripartite tricarboxylate transporter TctB family protein [Gammaproteobacteria bacterium]
MIEILRKNPFNLFLVIFSLCFLLSIPLINKGMGYDSIGPRFFPWLISLPLFILALTGAFSLASTNNIRHNYDNLVLPFVIVLLSLLLIEYLGFIVTMTLIFTTIAFFLSQTDLIRKIIIGLIFSSLLFIFFSYFLNISLPSLIF